MRWETKRILRSRYFIGAMLLMVLCLSGYAMCDWVFAYKWDVATRPSALQQTIGGIYFGGVIFMLPFCAALSVGMLQVDETRTGVMDYQLIRASVGRYAFHKLSASFLAAGLAVGVGFLIHSALWNILATPCDPVANPYLEIPYAKDCIYYAWQPICYSLPIYLWMAVAMFFCGGVWGTISVTAALYTGDRLLTLAIPFCIYFLWHYGLPRVLLGFRVFPHPADLYNDALTVPMIGESLLVYGILLGITVVCYVGWLRRKVRT